MKTFTIDAAWVGELVRQGVLLAVAMRWLTVDDTQQALLLSFLSLLVTGLVGMRTASARVLEKAGTSPEHIKGIAADDTKTLTVTHVDGSKD